MHHDIEKIHQDHIKVVNVYKFNSRVSKYMKQKKPDRTQGRHKKIQLLLRLQHSITATEKVDKISKNVKDLNNTTKEIDLLEN